MSIYRESDGLIWSSLFQVRSKEELKQIQNADFTDYQADALVRSMIEHADFSYDDGLPTACERVALNFCLIQSNFAQEMLTVEELEKAQMIYARKQYNSKILKKLLARFDRMLTRTIPGNRAGFEKLFYLDVHKELNRVHDEETDRIFAPLKKVINEVSAGVKGSCYFKAESVFRDELLAESLNQYLIDTEGYDYNSAQSKSGECVILSMLLTPSYLPEEKISLDEKMLRMALLDNNDFWEAHSSFHVVNFLNAVAEQNDQRHAEKILKFIFSVLKAQYPQMKTVLEHQYMLPMAWSDEVSGFLEDRTFRFTFGRFEAYSDLSVLKNQTFCYPISPVEDLERKKKIGKQLFHSFILEYSYPKQGNEVMEFLRKEVLQSNDCSDLKNIGVILDGASFSNGAMKAPEREMLNVLYPDCFSVENIWNRVYLKAYGVTLLATDQETRCSLLHESFYDVLKTVEQKTGIATVHQTDDSKRNQCVAALQEKLGEFGISVGDSFRFYYLVSLLDRKIARMDEAEHFAELEQLGDAIYGFAVAETLFYSPEYCRSDKMAKGFENLTRAETQVQISHKTGLNQLYLSAGFSSKYPDYDSVFYDFHDIFLLRDQQRKELKQEKHLADSLEMILGAVCMEHGVHEALDLAKKLLRITFGEKLPNEVRPTDENKCNTAIDRDYWKTILPAPCEMHNWTVIGALEKLLLAVSLGTDTPEKRNYIANGFGIINYYGSDSVKNREWVLYDYLHHGFQFVVEKYKENICDCANEQIANRYH